MFSTDELEELRKVSSTLRKMILFKDESEAERNIAGALVYLDAAVYNIRMTLDNLPEVYRVFPSIAVKAEDSA